MNILLGPPGTGKTTRLLSIIEQAVANGTPMDKIVFLTFSKRAIREARTRICQNMGLDADSIQNFRTLHSFTYLYCSLGGKSVMRKRDFIDLGEVLGIEFEDFEQDVSRIPIVGYSDRALFIDSYSRNTMTPLKDAWERTVGESNLDFLEVQRISEGLRAYKDDRLKNDYTDFLERFIREPFYEKFSLLLVDEAQDLSALQWACIEKIAKNCKKTYVAGDDDQAIYEWCGASAQKFISMEGEVEVLNKSYRLPEAIHTYSKGILGCIKSRRQKEFAPATHEGEVSYLHTIDELDFSQGTWLLLGYANHNLIDYRRHMMEHTLYYSLNGRGPADNLVINCIRTYLKMQRGIPVHNAELEKMLKLAKDPIDYKNPWQEELSGIELEPWVYYKTLAEDGVDFLQPPRIQISTIHSAKGAEADNVVICPDVSGITYRTAELNPDAIARVFYVGVTRAKKNLYILIPRSKYYFEL